MSFMRYPGGKTKLRHEINAALVEQIGDRNLRYLEPFFGGGSIGIQFLAKNPRIKNIWINDKDIGIACIWTAVYRCCFDFKERIRSFQPTVGDFHEFRKELLGITEMPAQHKVADIVDIAFKKLAIHQISYSGLGTKSGGPLGGVSQKSAYKIDCRWSANYICKKIDAIHDQLSEVKVYQDRCTSFDFMCMIEDTSRESIIYLDPPYYIKGNDLYQCGFELEDHERLASALQKTSHSWVLSYDDCPEIRKLYSWATLKPLAVNYSITATKEKETGKRLSRKKTELLICR